MPSLRSLFLGAGFAVALATPPGLLAREPQALLPTRSNDPMHWGTFISCARVFEQFVGPHLPDWAVHTQVLSYASRKPRYDEAGRPLLDAQGRRVTEPIHLSGRVFYPPAWRMRPDRRMPIVIYSQGTTLLKDAVASEFGGHEWMFAAAAAAYYGFAVAMPDPPGMGGDGQAYHPYCHAQSLAYAVVDSIPAIRGTFREDPYLVRNGYAWDGRVFLMGYSEGGFASLAAAREMETHREDFTGERGFMLAGSACMAGPFDLPGTMRRRILQPGTAFDHPFFIPYFVLGYHEVYGRLWDPLEVLKPELLRTEDDGNLLSWCNGFTDGLVVNERIAIRMKVPIGGVVLRDMLNPEWTARVLDDPAFESGPLRDVLRENDPGLGWAPTRPILFAQSPEDRVVPLGNTLAAMASLAATARERGQDTRGLLQFQLLCRPGSSIGHVAGAFLGIPKALDWIYRGMPDESQELAGYDLDPAPALP